MRKLNKYKKSLIINNQNVLIDCCLFKFSYNLFKLNNNTVIYVRCLLDFFIVNISNLYLYFHFIVYNYNLFCKFKIFYLLKKKTNLIFDLKFIFCFYSLFPLNLFVKIYSFSFYYTSFILNNIYIKNIGIYDKLNVTGYARKFWYSKGKTLLNLKVGRSYMDKILIPKKMLLFLIKKRLIFFYCSSKRLLKFFTRNIFNFQPADPYKGEGIQLHSKGLFLKDRFVKK